MCFAENEIQVLQPSGYIITAKKLVKDERPYVTIAGEVITDNKIRNIEVKLI